MTLCCCIFLGQRLKIILKKICQLVDNISRFILKIQIQNLVQIFLMIFFGGILDKMFQKVPHRFLQKFWRQKIA